MEVAARIQQNERKNTGKHGVHRSCAKYDKVMTDSIQTFTNLAHRTIDGVVEHQYTTPEVGSSRPTRSCNGFRSAQRQHILSGAQCAPARKSAAVAFGEAGGTAADYGRRGAQGIAKPSVPGSGLVAAAGASEWKSGVVRYPLAVCAEPDAFVTD